MLNKENPELSDGGKMNTDGSQVSGAESKSPIIELEYFTISKEKKIKS